MVGKPDKLAEYYKRKYPLAFSETSADEELKKRYEKAWNIAKEASIILKRDFRASKVAVFGSLTDLSVFTRWSDIDLAVWDIPENEPPLLAKAQKGYSFGNYRFYAAVGAVTGLPSDFKIDLVDAVDCRESLKKAIEFEGVEL